MWQGSINCSCHVKLLPRRGLVGGGLEMDNFLGGKRWIFWLRWILGKDYRGNEQKSMVNASLVPPWAAWQSCLLHMGLRCALYPLKPSCMFICLAASALKKE